MWRLKTNWKFDVLKPGFLLVLALLLIDLSFLYYQCDTLIQKSCSFLIAAYLLYLLFYKFNSLRWFSLVILFIAFFATCFDKKQTDFVIRPSSQIVFYPDQVDIFDDWFTVEGQVEKSKVKVSGRINSRQIQQIKSGYRVKLYCLSGDVNPIEPASNYGQFDLQKFYRYKNISQEVKLTSYRIKIDKSGIWNYLHFLRFHLKKFFQQMPPILSFFSSELILGENPSRRFQTILNNYRDLGVIHILSISGLHVGIYTLLISKFCYFLKLTEGETFVFCLLILLVGIFLSNSQVGFIRASLTYILGQLFSIKNKLQINKSDLLGLTAILHLIINPRLMMSTGAVLSYILALGLEMTNHMTKFKQSFSLNNLLLPLLLFYFFQFNILTVFFNLLIVPYFNWVVMPLTFLNLLIFKINPKCSFLFERILELGEKQIAQISNSKIGLLTFGKINWWQCLFLLILTSIILIWTNEKPNCKKIIKRFIVCLLFIYGLVFLTIHFPLQGQVTFIDVGQGDSIFISTPFFRKVYLIDVGGKLNFNGKKINPQVNKITLPFLKAQGISKINGIFITHQDADHVGDLKPLLNQIKVENLYVARGLIQNPSFQKRITGKIKKDQIIQLLAGNEVNDSQLSFQTVYPFKPGLGKNEDSLSLTFKLAGKRWLFTGDLGQEGELEIMNQYHLHVNYFKLGHHGSRTASNKEFLKALHPERVFISAGRRNRFGHPHPETMETLQSQHIPWASTQDCGMITWTYGAFVKPKFKRFLPVIKK